MNQAIRTSTLALATLFALAACGDKTASTPPASASAPTTASAPAPAAATASEPAPGGTASEQDQELLKQA